MWTRWQLDLVDSEQVSIKPICPVCSCIIIDAWLWFRSLVSCRNFFKGCELSIECNFLVCREVFQHLDQCLPKRAAKSWWSTVVLWGKPFLRYNGRCLGSLESPWVAFFTSSSVCLLGAKPWWPGTQMRHKLITPFVWPFHASPSLVSCACSSQLNSPSCFACNVSAALCI